MSFFTPAPASWSARSYSVGPEPSARSSDGSPLSSSAQLPIHSPLTGSSEPTPTTRVGRRAAPPSTLRANPVVKSFTVDAGMNGWSGFTLQRVRPDWSAIAMPHSPGAERSERWYHDPIRSVSHWESVWAASGAEGIWRQTASANSNGTARLRNDKKATARPSGRRTSVMSGGKYRPGRSRVSRA